ncbi:chloride intracellular channel protein 5 [Tupaia chinensis]|uniref:chloride intracellular channel protein 5 n=1 Tax=Tupaia chinensis TaxID=246437 RepID=UPI000FFC750C|nr:chloride intracellular channel protein 5 [Tupaia chinensis]
MNDEDYSSIYDIIQKERMYEVPDEPDGNEGPFYDEVHEDLGPESSWYATRLETDDYDSVPVSVTRGEENRLASSHPEAGDYVLPDEMCPEDPQPGEPNEDKDSSVGEAYSPTQDQEFCVEEPQEDESMTKEDLPSLSSFTIQQSEFSPVMKQENRCSSYLFMRLAYMSIISSLNLLLFKSPVIP